MAKAREVLDYLLPNGGWTIQGEDFDSIVYDENIVPVTKKQFDDAAKVVDEFLTQQSNARAAARTSALNKLSALGLTDDEVKAIIG